MARIPRAEDIGGIVRDAQTPIVQATVSDAGSSLQKLGAAINTSLDARSRYQYAQAASEFLVRKTKEDTAYDQDQDYATIEQRYATNIGAALEESSTLISNPQLRNEFMTKYKVDAAQGAARIRQVAFGKERDYQRGYINQQLDGIANAAIVGDVEGALDTGQALLMTARDQGYLSAEEYTTTAGEFRQKTKLRLIGMMNPQERIDAINSQLGADIPADVKFRLQQEAKAELVDNMAIGNVDAAMAQLRAGATPTQVTAGFANIKDPDVRTKTEDRFNQQFARMRVAEADEAATLVSKYVLPLRLGQTRFADIAMTPDGAQDLARLATLSPDALASLQAAEQTIAPTPEQREAALGARRAAYQQLTALARQIETGGPPFDPTNFPSAAAEFRDFLSKNAHLLEMEDFEKFAQIEVNANIPAPVKGWLTDQQRFQDAINQVLPTGWNETKRNRAEAEERAAMNAWRQNLGHEPSYDEVQAYLDKMVLRRLDVTADTKRGLFGWGGDKAWEDLTDAERDAEMERMAAGGDRARIARARAKLGKGATPSAIRAELALDELRDN